MSENNKTMGAGKMAAQLGAMIAFLIGSGFASGQEIVQYFSGWGSIFSAVMIAVITFIMMYLGFKAYAYAGRSRGLRNINEIFTFYGGKAFGTILLVIPLGFTACAYFFMCSGFANTLHQQWPAIPIPVGLAVAIIISVGSAVLGLNKMVDIIGKIGPVIAIFSLFIGIIAAFSCWPMINEGNMAVNSGAVEVTRAGATPLLAGISFGGCCLLLPTAYVGNLSYELREYKFKYTTIILLVEGILYVGACLLLGLDHMGNIQESATYAIPNLLLASKIFGAASTIMSTTFAIIILLAIYTTICPLLWSTITLFTKTDKSIAYKITCVIVGIVVYFVCLFVPYQTLLNYIMTYFGYCGFIVFAVCTVRYFYVKHQDKANGMLVE